MSKKGERSDFMYSAPVRTPAHRAWLLPAGTLFFACGILLGKTATGPFPALVGLGLSLLAFFLSRNAARSGAVLAIALTLGAAWGWQAHHPPIPEEGVYLVRGVVCDEIRQREDGQVQTVLTAVALNGTPQPDAYWTFYLDEGTTAPPDWLKPGAAVTLSGRAYLPSGQENPGGFDFHTYLLQQNIRFGLFGCDALAQAEPVFTLKGLAAQIRWKLSTGLMDVMGEESGAYAAAMLLGTQAFIPSDDRAAFQDLGIAHILSISGYHVGVLICMMSALLKPMALPRRTALLLKSLLLSAYCLLTGMNAPAIRAAGLLILREILRLKHIRPMPLPLLSGMALLQLLCNPTLITSPSFHLSYSAMFGLMMISPRLTALHTFRRKSLQWLWETFCISASVQLGILWPQLYWFGELPLLSIFLNLGVTLLSGILIALYWVTLFVLKIPGAAALMGGVSAAATTVLLQVIRNIASFDFTTLWCRQADGVALLGWGLLLFFSTSLVTDFLARRRIPMLLTGLLLFLTLLIPLPEDSSIIQLSVGNGDAAVLQDRSITVVIDTGEDGQALASYLHQRRQTVEILLITHLHKDHAGGVAALLAQNIPVQVCYLPADAQTPYIEEEVLPLLAALASQGTEFRYLKRGDVIPLPTGALRVLWPLPGHASPLHSANDVCLTFQAEVSGVTMLCTGDLSSLYEMYAAVPSDILKVAHHGSRDATSPAFLSAVDPQLLLLSNSNQRRTQRIQEMAGPIPVYATGTCGAITIELLGDGVYTLSPFIAAF